MLAALVNGSPPEATHGVSLEERGLAYGDGLFETMLLRAGSVRLLSQHLARLARGCERLGIAAPADTVVRKDLEALLQRHTDGIVKLIVTRGAGGRGYRASESLVPTRIALLYPPLEPEAGGIAVRWCESRLARNAQLAGIKHLNRLEHVLAQNEWHDPTVAEGLMCDLEGEVVCATASNLFIVADNVLLTADLRYSGVRGVMRGRVLDIAKQMGIEMRECALRPEDVRGAREIFLTNAVRGIRPVCALENQRWDIGPVTQRLAEKLESSG